MLCGLGSLKEDGTLCPEPVGGVGERKDSREEEEEEEKRRWRRKASLLHLRPALRRMYLERMCYRPSS